MLELYYYRALRITIPQCAPCSASTDDVLKFYWYHRWHVVLREYDQDPLANLDRHVDQGIVSCANSLDTYTDVVLRPISVQNMRERKYFCIKKNVTIIITEIILIRVWACKF